MTEQKTLLVLGGTSDIGRATALRYGENGWRVLLAGRDLEALARNADDVAVRTRAGVSVHRLDILETAAFAAFVDALPVLPDTVVCVVGLLGEQRLAETDLEHAALIMRTNHEGPALLLGLLAQRFCGRGSGTIVGVSSVAGDRGRGSNYVYGSAKAGFTAYLSGLRTRLARAGIRVVTVKPGFVRTRMTRGLELPALLTAQPGEVGAAIFRAAEVRGRDVIYVRAVWRIVMAVIVLIPEAIFKKLSI